MRAPEECEECGGVSVHSEDCKRGARELEDDDDDRELEELDHEQDEALEEEEEEDDHAGWCPGCEKCL